MAAPFRLARVLRLREQLRRLRAHEAEQLAAQLTAARQEAMHIATERERCGEEEGRAALAGLLTPVSLQIVRTYDGALASRERAQHAEVERLAAALEVKRAELRRERQEEEKYVRLAEAHRQRTMAEEARELDRALDEIAIDRHRRNRKEQHDGQL